MTKSSANFLSPKSNGQGFNVFDHWTDQKKIDPVQNNLYCSKILLDQQKDKAKVLVTIL